jgi:diguanylate cyclase (GGDEF)-like protein
MNSRALPNFQPEDYLALLRAAVVLAWGGVIAMALLKVAFHLRGLEWPQLGGFDTTYLAILAEFTLTTSMLSVLAIRRDWFDRVPREASEKLRGLLMLVVVWLSLHYCGAFHLLGSFNGPLRPLLPVLIMMAFLALPASGAWATALLLLAGHLGVGLMEYNQWIHPTGLFAATFALDRPAGIAVLALALGGAMGLGVLARRQLDRAGANLHRGTRVNPLTGLYEQGFLLERLRTGLQRESIQGGALTLLLVEFDGFAEFTARHGYDAGRRALREGAAALIGHTRHEMDTPARYAPTTFALLLPDARAEAATAIAARMRAAISQSANGILRTRAGMACVTRAAGVQPEAVIEAAVEALRRATADADPVQVSLP